MLIVLRSAEGVYTHMLMARRVPHAFYNPPFFNHRRQAGRDPRLVNLARCADATQTFEAQQQRTKTIKSVSALKLPNDQFLELDANSF